MAFYNKFYIIYSLEEFRWYYMGNIYIQLIFIVILIIKIEFIKRKRK